MGIIPPYGRQEVATGINIPVVYHGGSVMRGVTLHSLFWAPPGYQFGGPPSSHTLGYKQLIQQFLTDAAHDSAANTNVFSALPQYGDGAGQGAYSFQYDAAKDSIDDTNPFPPSTRQCPSPASVATCVTDLQLQQELDRVIQAQAPGARGQNNVWIVFLPPDVDTCIDPSACGTNAFGGYHAISNLGHGVTIYANIPDPLIAGVVAQGADPQGNPDAEQAIDVAGHEAVEAITDPVGTGWMDPNGNEVADKCEIGPQHGTPLGYAANGSPYNQVINGHQYLLQGMWDNKAAGCVQRTTTTTSALPLAQVRMTQFHSRISGTTGIAKAGVRVRVSLIRTGTEVASANTSTRSDGSWGPVALRPDGAGQHGFGDDRDEIDVVYGPGGPRPEVILTGDGGNPFTQAGWTGWFELDNGTAVVTTNRQGAIGVEPCSQTGVLRLTIDGAPTEPPTDTCETETDASITHTGPLSSRSVLKLASSDNRAVTPLAPDGALISLTVPLGEPNSVSAVGNPLVPIAPGGFPSCTGDLQNGVVRCDGLVPGAGYTLIRSRGHRALHADADDNGSLRLMFRGTPALRGGDVVGLRNHAGRTLTQLHLSHLRVDVNGEQTELSSGRCEPGDYYGRPLSSPPTSVQIGVGVSGSGTICPTDGDASGLSSRDIEQTDDLSGGQTRTEVPLIASTAPGEDATVYGPFVALADARLTGPHNSVISSRARVALIITRASSHRVAFRAHNVNTSRGVAVAGLSPGVYAAKWVLVDANGDTRTIRTRFVEQGGVRAAQAAAAVAASEGARRAAARLSR